MMYKLQRLELVESLEKKGITDQSFLNALRQVEREKFIPSGVRQHTYRDIALPIGHGQTISQPYTIGIMTQALNVKKGNKALEIGTGSGYQAALLEKMGAKVIVLPTRKDGHFSFKAVLKELGKLEITNVLFEGGANVIVRTRGWAASGSRTCPSPGAQQLHHRRYGRYQF